MNNWGRWVCGSYHYVICDSVILHLYLSEGLVVDQNTGVRLAGLHTGV